MNDLHDQPPFSATQVVVLLGGPFDGEAWNVPSACREFHGDTAATRYRYCVFATALFGKACFIHQFIEHDFYAPIPYEK